MMSFRVYPPDYNPPLNQTPDGAFVTDDRIRVEKWGEKLNDVCSFTLDLTNSVGQIYLNNDLPNADYFTCFKTKGACWSRYYRLETSYYMSSLAMNTLGILKNNFLWQNTFTSTPMLEPGKLIPAYDFALIYSIN